MAMEVFENEAYSLTTAAFTSPETSHVWSERLTKRNNTVGNYENNLDCDLLDGHGAGVDLEYVGPALQVRQRELHLINKHFYIFITMEEWIIMWGSITAPDSTRSADSVPDPVN